MPKITVYTKPSCVQCNATYRTLSTIGKALGLGDEKGEGWYDSIDLAEQPEAIMDLKALGLMSAPSVLIHDTDGNLIDKWGGFNPSKLEELKHNLSQALVAA